MELCLSETAFVKAKRTRLTYSYQIRWFAPRMEIPLCGHATLAASKILFDEYGIGDDTIVYESMSGTLKAVVVLKGILSI